MDTKLLPNRFRVVRPIRWAVGVAFVLAWIWFPLTGEPLQRFYRTVTVRGPQCEVCHRAATGTVGYGTSGGARVSFCERHLADAPSSISFGPGGKQVAPQNVIWGGASVVLCLMLLAANLTPKLEFRKPRNADDPAMQVFDKHNGHLLASLTKPSGPVEGDSRTIRYLESTKPRSMSLVDYLANGGQVPHRVSAASPPLTRRSVACQRCRREWTRSRDIMVCPACGATKWAGICVRAGAGLLLLTVGWYLQNFSRTDGDGLQWPVRLDQPTRP